MEKQTNKTPKTPKTPVAHVRALTAADVKTKKGMGAFLQWAQTLPTDRAARVIAAALPKKEPAKKATAKPAKPAKSEKPVTVQFFGAGMNRSAIGWYKVQDIHKGTAYYEKGQAFEWFTEYFPNETARAWLRESEPGKNDFQLAAIFKLIPCMVYPAMFVISYSSSGGGKWFYTAIDGLTGAALALLNGEIFKGTKTPKTAEQNARAEFMEIVSAWNALKVARDARETTTTAAAE